MAAADTDCRKTLREIEEMLRELMITNDWSKTKLKTEVQERGICLRNGKEYGAKLPFALKKNRALVVPKKAAKEYPLAKKCLVVTPAY